MVLWIFQVWMYEYFGVGPEIREEVTGIFHNRHFGWKLSCLTLRSLVPPNKSRLSNFDINSILGFNSNQNLRVKTYSTELGIWEWDTMIFWQRKWFVISCWVCVFFISTLESVCRERKGILREIVGSKKEWEICDCWVSRFCY